MSIFSKTITIPSDAILENIFIQNNAWKPFNKPRYTLVQSSIDQLLFNKTIQLIQSAKSMICLQSFLIQDTEMIDALLQAKERGVKVYIMSAAEVRLEPQMCAEVEPDFIKEDYIKMLNNKFTGNFIHRSAAFLHAKYIVVDGKTNPRGMIFTNNFTKNGFFKNPEMAVELNWEQAGELFKLFVFHFWEKTTSEQTENNGFTPLKPFEQFEFPVIKELLVVCDKHNSLKNKILEVIRRAEYDICFSTFSFDNQSEVAEAIFEKQKAGVKIKIFTRLNDKLLQTQFKKYLDAGADIYCHTHTHAKFLMIDNQEAYLLTANFNKIDFETSFNLGVKLSVYHTNFLNEMVEEWEVQMHQWIDKKNVTDLKNYTLFHHGKLIDRTIEATKSEKEAITQIQTVDKLIAFVQKKRFFKDERYQRQQLTLEMNLQPFNGNLSDKDKYEVIKHDNFDLVKEYEWVTPEVSKKKQEVEKQNKNKEKQAQTDKNKVEQHLETLKTAIVIPQKRLKMTSVVLHPAFDVWNDCAKLNDISLSGLQLRCFLN